MIKNKNNAKRFAKFNNSGSNYYNFVNKVKFLFNLKKEYTNLFNYLNIKEDYSTLELHHIDGNPKNNSPFNLVVLPKVLHKIFDKKTEKEFWVILKMVALDEVILLKQRELIGVV